MTRTASLLVGRGYPDDVARKDVLLQEHGYFVLRFLVEDVGQRLDHVLDAILRTISLRDRASGE